MGLKSKLSLQCLENVTEVVKLVGLAWYFTLYSSGVAVAETENQPICNVTICVERRALAA